MGVEARRRRRIGRAVLVLAAVVVSVLAVQTTPARAGASAEGWVWPLAGPPPVTRGFDPPAERYGRGHRGVDLGGAPGAVVVAAGAGRVSYAGLLAGRGVVVVVHGELRTTYEPVTAEVAVGQQVAAGQPLGRLAPGHEGCAAAACLHWGLRRGEQYLDPLALVGAGPVRLLPLGPSGAATVPLPGTASEGAAQARPVAPLPAPEPAVEAPPLDLRAAVSPSGALAVLALVAGLALLVRPRPPGAPTGGASVAGAAAPEPERSEDAHEGPDAGRPDAEVLDLDHQRLLRRAGPE